MDVESVGVLIGVLGGLDVGGLGLAYGFCLAWLVMKFLGSS